MVVKTYRGILAHGAEDRIRLSTIKGKVGYRIVKFQIISNLPTSASVEALIKIYKSPQTTIDHKVNFSDSDLLSVGLWTTSGTAESNPEDMTVIFDNEIFNQDIYISYFTTTGSELCNYYLELEVIPLDDAGAEYTTLKDMRQPG